MKKIITLRFLLEYFCYPIRKYEGGDVYNINTDEIVKNPYLKKEINDLDDMYQATYNDKYPTEPLFNDNLREYIFTNRVSFEERVRRKVSI